MNKYLKRKSFFVRKNTLLIVRIDAIGDYILFRNFIKIIKESERFRGHKITLLGNKIWKDIAVEYDGKYIDKFIWIDTNKFFKKSEWKDSYIQLLKIHSSGYETILLPNDTFDWRSEFIVSMAGAGNIIGKMNDPFFSGNGKALDSKKINKIDSDIGHDKIFQFNRNKSFAEEITGESISLPGPYLEKKKKEADNEKYIVVFPGASHKNKMWSAENFGILCKRISEIKKINIIICGNDFDKRAAEKIIEISGIENISDKTRDGSLVELIDLISEAELLITNDTCALHIGAAVNTKTICLSNGLHFGRFHPYPAEISDKIRTLYPDEELYFNCNYEKLSRKYHLNSELDINRISCEDVLKYVIDITETEKGTENMTERTVNF